MVSELIDRLVEGAGQVISEVDKGGQIQTAISGIRQRMAEADRKRKVTRVKQEIQDLRAQEAQAINALSAQVLALYEAGSLKQPELISLCKGVDEVRQQVAEKEAELEQLQPPPPQQAPPRQADGGPRPDAAVRCPNCGVAVVAGAGFCQSCGGSLAEQASPPPALFCPHCGANLRPQARFCAKCGETIPEAEALP